MRSLEIVYYTGTGNTKRAAEAFAASCSAAGIATKILSIDRVMEVSPATGGERELLLAFPVYGFGAPHSLRAALKLWPSARRGQATAAKLRLLAVCGAELKGQEREPGWPGQALEQVERLLGRKGYELASSAYVSYPVNWTQMMTPPEGEEKDLLLRQGDAEVKAYAEEVLEGEASLYRCGQGNRLWSGAASLLFDAVGRRALGKIYATDSNCNECGLCARACPAGNIVMGKSGPRWKASCDACNRCINACPREAIQASAALIAIDLVASVAVFVAAFPLARLLLGAIGLEPRGWSVTLSGLVLALFLSALLMVFLFGPLEALWRAIARIPAARRFFSAGGTKKRERYLAPGFVPGKE
jgi:ferredoxin